MDRGCGWRFAGAPVFSEAPRLTSLEHPAKFVALLWPKCGGGVDFAPQAGLSEGHSEWKYFSGACYVVCTGLGSCDEKKSVGSPPNTHSWAHFKDVF